jgi:hypothetical protein
MEYALAVHKASGEQMFKHIVYIRHIVVVAVLACLGLATDASPAVQTRTLDQLQVNNVTAQKKHPPTKRLKGILAAPAAPTGLTVSPDPQNGTVMHLTWKDNAGSEKAFEVGNTVGRRDAPAHPGTGAVTYFWTGLKPGRRACFRARASNRDTFSAWDPSVGYKCATTSNPSPQHGPCTLKIDAVGPLKATAATSLEIVGSCFGTGNTRSGADTAYFRISDLSAGWNACWTGDPGTDHVTCDVPSWTSRSIIFNGFTGDYGRNGWVITKGDRIEVQVWNRQSGNGPATCEVVAGRSAATNC